MDFGRAEIGIVLIVIHSFIGLFGLNHLFVYDVAHLRPEALVFLLLTVVYLVLYIFGRKTFLHRIKDKGIARVSLVILSTIPMMEGVFLGIIASGYEIERHKIPGQIYPLTWEASMYQKLAALCSALVIFSAVLLLVDGLQFRLDRSSRLPLKQDIDLESHARYPKDLFAKYVNKYPQNAEGVLEWHIHKKMKDGKTRERATRELENK